MFSRLKTIVQMSLFAVVLTMFGNLAWAQDIDFGLHVQNLLNVYSEQLFGIKQPLDFCLVDEVKAGALTGKAPFITRFFAGGPDANYFDNLDFQPGTGRLVVLEDGEVEVQTGSGIELRGNDIWMLLPMVTTGTFRVMAQFASCL